MRLAPSLRSSPRAEPCPKASAAKAVSPRVSLSGIAPPDMEHLWSRAGATGGNQWQMRQTRKRLEQANPQPSAAHGTGSRPHGKEGVDGSTPSQSFGFSPA